MPVTVAGVLLFAVSGFIILLLSETGHYLTAIGMILLLTA